MRYLLPFLVFFTSIWLVCQVIHLLILGNLIFSLFIVGLELVIWFHLRIIRLVFLIFFQLCGRLRMSLL